MGIINQKGLNSLIILIISLLVAVVTALLIFFLIAKNKFLNDTSTPVKSFGNFLDEPEYLLEQGNRNSEQPFNVEKFTNFVLETTQGKNIQIVNTRIKDCQTVFNIIDKKNKTMLDYVIDSNSSNKKQIIDLLRKHGAKTAQELKEQPTPSTNLKPQTP